MNTEQTNDKPIFIRCNEDGLWEKYEPYMTIDCPTEEDYNFIVRALEHYKQSEGEWIDKPTGAYGRWQSWCSACGKHSGIGGIESNRHKPFCPNCGAKMKGENK